LRAIRPNSAGAFGPALKSKIGYRCLKNRDGQDYYHLATVLDDSCRVALQECAFFKHYTEATKAASSGTVEVVPLEVVAETAARVRPGTGDFMHNLRLQIA
jgi:hypothetical protein